ncbi:MAG: site-specific DNA-methyltransferase [Atopobiaceae bacterium]|jgi:DNA modification methylase|nr:site-specific DNA-methyltransferase [Atopobiaceae bacterium]
MINYNTSYNVDSDAFMDQLIDEGISFDLILTDPPYNLHKDFGNNSDCLDMPSFLSENRSRIEKCSRLLNPSGSLIWFGIHNYIGYLQTIMYETGLFYRRMNIWHYDNGFTRSNKAPAHTYEPFLWFSKSNSKWVYNADDVRVPYKSTERLKSPVYYKSKNGERREWKPNPKGALRGDIWDYPTLAGSLYKNERTNHPTQKPEALITEIIMAYCPKDKDGRYCGTIYDPFHGSGTLGVCCEKLNRQGNAIRWIGSEIEKRWCDVAQSRLAEIGHDDD